MKKNTNKQLAAALHETTKDACGADLEKIIKNFVLLLCKERKIKQAGNIISEFLKYAKKQAGIAEVEIITTREMDDSIINKVQAVLGQKIEAIKKVDNRLLGGLIIKIEDTIFDASIKTQINRLKLSISK